MGRRTDPAVAVSSELGLLQHLGQHGTSITMLLDAAGNVSIANAAFTRLLGHDSSIIVGHSLAGFCADGTAAQLSAAIARTCATGAPSRCDVAMRCADPTIAARPIRFEFVNLLDDPAFAGVLVTGYDVSDLQLARQSLEHLARHDLLTGLANRSVLLEALDKVVEDNEPAAALFIGLDRFKPVNDLLGHEAGDELLCQVSARLRSIVRPGDLVARVGGDEFVVLALGVIDRPTGLAFCDRIDTVLAEPYLLKAGPARVTASVGFAVAGIDSTVTGILADADLSMIEAKADRHGDVVTRDSMRHRSANERRRLADDLALGLRRGEVVAYLQPIVELESGRTVAVEALARWNHPTMGTLNPMAFLDLAEDAGLDLLLGDAVLRSACTAVASLPRAIRLGINLSVGQLTDRGLCDRIALILECHHVPPARLTVEITERATLSQRAGAGKAAPERTLMELRELGAYLSLDDFGTGYSSLTHIRRYPLHELKIDRCFVAGVREHAEDRAVIRAVIGMASALGLAVVAEGVETLGQFHALRELGCDLAQGFLIARPLPPESLLTWITEFGDDWRHTSPVTATTTATATATIQPTA